MEQATAEKHDAADNEFHNFEPFFPMPTCFTKLFFNGGPCRNGPPRTMSFLSWNCQGKPECNLDYL